MSPTNRKQKRGANRRVTQNKFSGNRQLMEGNIHEEIEFKSSDLIPRAASSMVPSAIPKDIPNQIHWFTRNVATSLSGSLAIDTVSAQNFQLGFLPSSTDFTSLFDQYCIVAVRIKIVPVYNINQSNSGDDLGTLITAIDYDDSNAAFSANDLRQYQSALVTPSYIGQTRVIYPRIAVGAYQGAFSGYANQRSWVDCASTAVEHYGLKLCLTVQTGVVQTLRIEYTYFVALRSIR